MIRTETTAERLSYGDFAYRITVVYHLLFLWWTVRYLAKRKTFGLGFWWFKDGDSDPVVQPIADRLGTILTDKLAAKEVKPVLFTCGPPRPMRGYSSGGIVHGEAGRKDSTDSGHSVHRRP